MNIRINDRLAIAFTSSVAFWLSACNGELAVVDDLDGQSSNLTAADGNEPTDSGQGNETDSDNGCGCATSPSLMALSCGYGEVPLLDNDVVQTTADGQIVAFNVNDASEVLYWDGGATARAIGSGMMLGLDASGQRVLVADGNGLEVLDTAGGRTQVAMNMIVGHGSFSAAGDVVVGATSLDGGAHLARANASTGEIEVLGQVGDYIDRAYVTPDASTIVGTAGDFSNDDAANPLAGTNQLYRWNAQGLSFALPGVPAGTELWPEAVSDDGSVIAGRSPLDQKHFRWTEAGGYVEVASASWRSATLLSADGSVVLGSLTSEDNDSAAFRWTESTGAVDLMPGIETLATDMSNDGNVIVATSWEDAQNLGTAPLITFIWDAEHGTRSLDEVLHARGVDVSGWAFGHARALSDDGKVLLGRGLCGGNPTLYRIVLSD
jgi:hypothetical protein